MAKEFRYRFNAGPLSSKKELLDDWQEGNCRRALQWYFWDTREIFLPPLKVLCPQAYHKTGIFILEKGYMIDTSLLQEGDIVYAERLRDKNGLSVDKSETTFPRKDNYVTSLHTAIYVGTDGGEIWHATVIEGRSCSWSLDRFLKFYRFVAVKRLETLNS